MEIVHRKLEITCAECSTYPCTCQIQEEVKLVWKGPDKGIQEETFCSLIKKQKTFDDVFSEFLEQYTEHQLQSIKITDFIQYLNQNLKVCPLY